MADTLIALKAGPEKSVAATKSYICALAALRRADRRMVARTPRCAARSPRCPTTARARLGARLVGRRRTRCATRNNLFVIGRGYGFGIAQEAALKLKETCALHAEAFSAAEVRHGPMAIVDDGFPVLALRDLRRGRRRRARCGAPSSPRAARACCSPMPATDGDDRVRAALHRASGDRADPDDPELLPHGQRAVAARAASIPMRRRISAR